VFINHFGQISPLEIKHISLRPSAKLREPTKNSHAVAVFRSVQWQRPCETGDHQTSKSDGKRFTATCFFWNNGGEPTCVTFCTHMSGVCSPLTTVCYVNFNSWKERRKGNENSGWFDMFHLRLSFTFYCTHIQNYPN
jgi:hypothetical protein